MNYRLAFTDEQAEARASMPRNADGFIVNLFYLPPKERATLEPKWREWARTHPRALWPDWLVSWATTHG